MARRRGKRPSQKKVFFITSIIALIFVAGTAFMVKWLLVDDSKSKKRQIHMLRLVEPPPPPPPKQQEKPPEPEVKKEEIKQPEQKKEVAEQKPQEGPKPGNQLGLDSDGTGGSDGFGLVARKGGVPLIGGGGGEWTWYNRLVQGEIQRELERLLNENGGIPKGKLQAGVKLTLDERGRVVSFLIYSPSGNESLDKVLQEALKKTVVSQAPPEGMPRTLKFRVSTQG
jgi:protein TonB